MGDYKRTNSGQNRFVPQGSKNGRNGGAGYPTADASISIGLEQNGYSTDPVARNPYGALGPDQQDFNGARCVRLHSPPRLWP